MQSDLFEGADTVVVRQSKELLEMFIGIEQRNRFNIDIGAAAGQLVATEEGSRWLRFFLGSMRPYTLGVFQRDGKPALKLHAPFRWIHREIFISEPGGKLLGTVRKRFTFIHTRYDIRDAHGRPLYEIARGMLKVWTFTVRKPGGEDVASIVKRWSGLGKEVFTDADRFQLSFGSVRDPIQRKILLGAMFLIDLRHFEDSGGE